MKRGAFTCVESVWCACVVIHTVVRCWSSWKPIKCLHFWVALDTIRTKRPQNQQPFCRPCTAKCGVGLPVGEAVREVHLQRINRQAYINF